MSLPTSTHEEVTRSICDAVVEASNGVVYVLALKVTADDRGLADACAQQHEYNNRAFAHQAQFHRGKNHFATIVRGYLGEIVIRRALGLPFGLADLVFDKPQKRPDILALAGYNLRLDMKTTEDRTARINRDSHVSDAKRPFAYLIADVQDGACHLWVVDADAVDAWELKSYPSAHFVCELPEPPTA